MIPDRDLKAISLFFLAVSFCLIPVIKFGTSVIPNALPWYLLLFVVANIFALFQFKIYRKRTFLVVSFIYVLYSVPVLIAGGITDFIILKYIAASFVSLTFASVLWEAFQEEKKWESFLTLIFLLLRYSAVFVFSVCIFSLFLAQTRWPIFSSAAAWVDILTFSRSEIILRNKLIAGSNLALVLTGNFALTSMQGPQLLIYPLLHTTLASLFPRVIKLKSIDRILFGFLCLGIVLLNSRAMIIYVVLLMINRALQNRESLERIFSIALIPFPFALCFLGNRFLNGRMAHIQYVIENVSMFGHGIGSGLRDMAKIPETLNSFTFDSIHLEILQYFGIFGYLISICLFVYFIIIRKCQGRFYITFLVFVFLALNFNLFDPYFLIPIMLLLTQPRKSIS